MSIPKEVRRLASPGWGRGSRREESVEKAVIVQAVGEYILRQEGLVRDGKGGPELLRVVEQRDRDGERTLLVPGGS